MTWLLRILIACSFVSSATAQTMTVRTGEHGAFTRIVLDFDARPDWTAGRTAGGYAIRFDPPFAEPPDLGRAFDLISRDRVSELGTGSEPGVFDISLGCDCWADISEFRSDALVIDIRPGSPPSGAAFEASLSRPVSVGPDVAVLVAVAHPPDLSDTAPSIASNPAPPQVRRIAARLPAVTDVIPRPPTPVQAVASTAPPMPSEAVAALAGEVARAVSQGLLEQEQAIPPVFSHAAAAPEVQNLTVDTAIDAALQLDFTQSGGSTGAGNCIPVNRINVADWGPENGVAGLGALRRQAIAEDGSLTETGLLSLARSYIHLGFGAEARSIGQMLQPGIDRAIILALADIADHGRSDAGILDTQFACSPEAGVWRALARPFFADDLPQDIAPILGAFSALPVTLRVHLGPVMGERLRQAGFPAESRIALNTVARGGNVSIEQMLTVARLDLTGTRADDARARLEELAAGTGLTAAAALFELLQDADRRGVPPDAEWVDDAPSLVRATRGTDVARSLARAALRGGLSLGRFDQVRRDLADGPAELTTADGDALLLELMAGVLATGPDDAFLKSEMLLRQRLVIPDLPRDLRLGILSRFVDLGLPNRALDYAPETAPSETERVLLARARSSTGDIEAALALLEGLPSEDALRQKARVLSLAGRPDDAAKAYLAANDVENGRREAIRAADWARVTALTQTADTGEERPQATEMRASEDDLGNAALIRRIADRRASLETLLALTGVE